MDNNSNIFTIIPGEYSPLEEFKGLYRPVLPLTIFNGAVAKYCKPGLAQLGLIMHFLIEGLKPIIDNSDELTNEQLFIECLKVLEDAAKVTTEEDRINQNGIIGLLFSNPNSIPYLYRAIKECFPDFQSPQYFTNDALISLFNIISEDALSLKKE